MTVDQTSNLVNQGVQVSWKNFTPTTDDLTGKPGAPSEDLTTNTLYHLYVYECKGTNPPTAPGAGLYSWVSNDCYQFTSNNPVGAQSGAANGMWMYTSANGAGAADMYVEAGKEINSFLGCDLRHPCSLVVIPNWGGMEPNPGTPTNCQDHSQDSAGALGYPYGYDAYLGYDCSWADRIVVPLSFLPSPQNCPLSASSFQSEGSPMLDRAMSEWIPRYCLGRNAVDPGYNSGDNEYVAREQFLAGSGAFSSTVSMALITRPPAASMVQASTRKFTYAPLVNSGIGIAFYLDNSQGKLITNLVLDARLIAKLLTQSYSLQYGCTINPGPPQKAPPSPSSYCDPANTHMNGKSRVSNPKDIFDDPEFLTLNGGDTPANRANFPSDLTFPYLMFGNFLPTVVSGDSDLTYELTRWIESDPSARAFLTGKPDPWGMEVNRDYRNIAYPADQLVPLDQGWTGDYVKDHVPSNNYIDTMQVAWNTVNSLQIIGSNMASLQPNADDPDCIDAVTGYGCQASTTQQEVKPLAPELPGSLDLFSVVDLGQAAGYRLPLARLVNAAGHAVAPTTAALSAGLRDMTTNADGITQQANYATRDAGAYPLAMVDYAMVPTCKTSRSAAASIAAFLTDVSSNGQRPGLLPGELAPGYFPLDQAQRRETSTAAHAVAVQNCSTRPPDRNGSGGGHHPGGGPGGNGPGSSGSGHQPRHGATTPSAGPTTPIAQNVAYGVKDPNAAGVMRIVLPVLLILGALLAIGGPGAYVLGTTQAGAVIRRRVMRLLRPGRR